MAEQPTNRDRVKEIVAGIERNIQELFQSEKYFDYLRTMAQFHSYSANNTILIHMQRPHAAAPVAGFQKWKRFGRHVKKGEKGLTIIAPTPLKKRIEEMRLDPDTRAPALDQDGNVIIDERTVEIPLFKPVKVFSADQTEGAPLPSLSANLTGDVQQYEAFMEALRRTSPVPITFQPLPEDTDGIFHQEKQCIRLREGMSQVQTVCAAVHEIGHAVLHDREWDRLAALIGDAEREPPKVKDENTREVEAESVSYAVCQYYGIDTGANSIGYIAGWSKDKSLPELRASLETISKTVNGLITAIDKHFAEVCKEQGIDLAAPALSVPEEPDTPEKYVADFFAQLDELHAAGLVPAPHPPDKRESFAHIFLRYLREGNFDSFRYVLDDTAERANAPAIAALRDRLEKMSDQWDAALTCKIEPVFGPDTAESRSMILTYEQRDGQTSPGKVVFTGSMDECRRIVAGLEAGTITLRDVRRPDFEPPNPPEPRYIYLMDANPEMAASDGQHYIEAYERTALGELKLDRMLFAGAADVCAGLLERLENGMLQYEDFFIVRAARVSYYTAGDGGELDALVGPDDKVYLGRRDHYDNRGHYLNNDHSLMHISDNDRVFNVISGVDRPRTQEELQATGYFTQEELENFAALPLHSENEPEAPSIPPPPEQADEAPGLLAVSSPVLEAAVETLQPEQGRSCAGEPQAHLAQEDAALPDTALDEYPMPDSTMTLDDLAGLGHSETDLLPLSRDRAAEFLDQDMTVYSVRTGENPEMVFDREDLMEQPEGVMFSISREEWEKCPDFRQAVAERMNHQEDRERAFLNHAGDCFAIYQIKDGDEQRDLRFMNMDWLMSKGLTADRDNYELAYTGELAPGQGSSALERLWQKFNIDHPADYHRPSMSVSDILAVKQDGVVSFHYCDSFGFAKVPDFIKAENDLKKEPAAADLEQQARSGQPVSRMDAAGAERGEKRSVRSRLNAAQSQGQRKAQKKRVGKER